VSILFLAVTLLLMILENPNTKRAARVRISAPGTAKPFKILPGYFVGIVGVHMAAMLVFVPWFFSWTGVVLFIAGHYVFGMLGMTLCYHRLLTHRGFTCSKRLEHFLAVLGVCCLQDSPARWVAVHRKHHQHSDEESDPHSPLVAAFWGHFGWLMAENREFGSIAFYEHYARDILKDPFYLYFERHLMWLWWYIGHAVLFFVVGSAAGWISTGQPMGGVQFGASLLVWGVFARTVFVWHVTWSVNSLTHLWGSRRFETDDNSRNNWLVGLLAHGEGWHNNHHADPVSTAHGMRWWEFDFTYWTICALEAVGLAKNVVRPRIDLND
jgi:fatty-acid desaturase